MKVTPLQTPQPITPAISTEATTPTPASIEAISATPTPETALSIRAQQTFISQNLGPADTISATINLSNSMVYGSSTLDILTLSEGVSGIVIDQNVDHVKLPGSINDYTFNQTGNILNVYDSTGSELIVKGPVREEGTLYTFADTSLLATVTAGTIRLGDTPLLTAPTNTIAQIYTPTPSGSQPGATMIHPATKSDVQTLLSDDAPDVSKSAAVDAIVQTADPDFIKAALSELKLTNKLSNYPILYALKEFLDFGNSFSPTEIEASFIEALDLLRCKSGKNMSTSFSTNLFTLMLRYPLKIRSFIPAEVITEIVDRQNDTTLLNAFNNLSTSTDIKTLIAKNLSSQRIDDLLGYCAGLTGIKIRFDRIASTVIQVFMERASSGAINNAIADHFYSVTKNATSITDALSDMITSQNPLSIEVANSILLFFSTHLSSIDFVGDKLHLALDTLPDLIDKYCGLAAAKLILDSKKGEKWAPTSQALNAEIMSKIIGTNLIPKFIVSGLWNSDPFLKGEFLNTSSIIPADVFDTLPAESKDSKTTIKMLMAIRRAEGIVPDSYSNLPFNMQSDRAVMTFFCQNMSMNYWDGSYTAIRQNPLLGNPAFVAEIVKLNPKFLNIVPAEIWNNRELLRTCVSNNHNTLEFINTHFGGTSPASYGLEEISDNIKKAYSLLDMTAPQKRFDNNYEFIRGRYSVANKETRKQLINILGREYFDGVDSDSRPLAVIIQGSMDYNDAFSDLGNNNLDILTLGYRVVYYKVLDEYQFLTNFKEATLDKGVKADLLIIAGHGNPTGSVLSGTTESTTLDISDKDQFKSISEGMNQSGQIVLESCSTGRGGDSNLNNVAHMWASVFPQSYIFAPRNDTNSLFELNSDQLFSRPGYQKGDAETYVINPQSFLANIPQIDIL